MKLMGDAFSGVGDLTPLIGIMPWQKVSHRELFFSSAGAAGEERGQRFDRLGPGGGTGELGIGGGSGDGGFDGADGVRTQRKVHYVKRVANSSSSSAIDQNHTHFLLVDNGKDKWGGEIKLRADIERALRRKLKTAAVLLVVQVRAEAVWWRIPGV